MYSVEFEYSTQAMRRDVSEIFKVCFDDKKKLYYSYSREE